MVLILVKLLSRVTYLYLKFLNMMLSYNSVKCVR